MCLSKHLQRLFSQYVHRLIAAQNAEKKALKKDKILQANCKEGRVANCQVTSSAVSFLGTSQKLRPSNF